MLTTFPPIVFCSVPVRFWMNCSNTLQGPYSIGLSRQRLLLCNTKHASLNCWKFLTTYWRSTKDKNISIILFLTIHCLIHSVDISERTMLEMSQKFLFVFLAVTYVLFCSIFVVFHILFSFLYIILERKGNYEIRIFLDHYWKRLQSNWDDRNSVEWGTKK